MVIQADFELTASINQVVIQEAEDDAGTEMAVVDIVMIQMIRVVVAQVGFLLNLVSMNGSLAIQPALPNSSLKSILIFITED